MAAALPSRAPTAENAKKPSQRPGNAPGSWELPRHGARLSVLSALFRREVPEAARRARLQAPREGAGRRSRSPAAVRAAAYARSWRRFPAAGGGKRAGRGQGEALPALPRARAQPPPPPFYPPAPLPPPPRSPSRRSEPRWEGGARGKREEEGLGHLRLLLPGRKLPSGARAPCPPLRSRRLLLLLPPQQNGGAWSPWEPVSDSASPPPPPPPRRCRRRRHRLICIDQPPRIPDWPLPLPPPLPPSPSLPIPSRPLPPLPPGDPRPGPHQSSISSTERINQWSGGGGGGGCCC